MNSKKDKKAKPGEAEENAAAAQAGEQPAAEENAGQTPQQEPETQAGPEKQELSELDVMKLYLERAMAEVKRLTDESAGQKKALEEAQGETLIYKDKLSSVVAEYENFRRRTAQEKETLAADSVAKAAAAILPALDNLERALPFAQTNPESFRQGVEMTLKQLQSGFAGLGVTEIEAQGLAFDPDRHNAVMHVEDETLGDSVVAEVFQKGYAIGDRVIRHSVVKVAN